MEVWIPLLMFIVFGIAIASLVWQTTRSRELLDQWAQREGFQLLAVERRYMRRGPFFWTTSKGQEVFFVQVLDLQSGQVRPAWVRVGGWWRGLLSDQVDVRWEV